MTPRVFDLRLIVITDVDLARPRSILQVVDAALNAGAPALQLRLKHAPPSEVYCLGTQLRAMTRAADALLFINDRVDIALALGADGVHLGPTDLPVATARRAERNVADATKAPLIIGVSTDDPERARSAWTAGADYIGCGAVFGTTSKPDVGEERIGPEGLRRVVDVVPCPVVGIGGIHPENVDQVARTGAAGAAVIGSIMSADDVGEAVERLMRPFPIVPL